MEKILIVDDDKNICTLLQLYLKNDGYILLFAHDGSMALDIFQKESPDLILLDLMLPQISGLDVCRIIREKSDVPILMLTARDSLDERVNGLDTGADDYIVKPFDPPEVAARVRAHLRKKNAYGKQHDEEIIRSGKLQVNLQQYEVQYNSKAIVMTPKEVQLLHYLMQHTNQVLSREQIIEKVWGFDFLGETRTIDMHIKNIRDKIPADPSWKIKTIYGVGYKFEVN